MAMAHGRITVGMGWGENGFGAALCVGSSILLLFGGMFLGEKEHVSVREGGGSGEVIPQETLSAPLLKKAYISKQR
jgi:hypothetical protein